MLDKKFYVSSNVMSLLEIEVSRYDGIKIQDIDTAVLSNVGDI